tara:strand:- start:289 stop:399 length:111 start_codon:yes stop_codon:yes gene_type:complete
MLDKIIDAAMIVFVGVVFVVVGHYWVMEIINYFSGK